MKLKNQRGFFHLHLTWIVFIFALIGCWYVYKSYKENKLQENMRAVISDYQPIVKEVITLTKDKQIAQTALEIANGVASGSGGLGEQQLNKFSGAIGMIKELQKKYQPKANTEK